jgi:Tol biopolymer transport system component
MKKMALLTMVPIVMLAAIACSSRPSELGDKILLGTVRGSMYAPHIYAVDPKIGEVALKIPLRAIGQLIDEPDWSPNRQWIAYTTGGNKSELYIMQSDGGKRIKITDFQNGRSNNPVWSPDGNNVAYFATGNMTNASGIYVLDVSCVLVYEQCDFVPKFITKGYFPSWSPDGQKLVFQTYDEKIAIVDIQNLQKTEILTPNDFVCLNPKWFTNGQLITFSCFANDHHDVYYINLLDMSLINVTNGIGNNTLPTWSPDGLQIAFVSDRDGLGEILGFDDTIRSNALFLANIDGSGITQITTYRNEKIKWIKWINP